MKILTSEDSSTHCILLNTKEAKELYKAFLHVTEQMPKPLNKQTKAFKLAHEIAELLNIW